MNHLFYRITSTAGLIGLMASLLSASESTTVYGFDFSKTYADPDDRTVIMEDMMSGLEQAEEVIYRTTDEEDLKLWVFSPETKKNNPSSGKIPAIVFIHGGGWGGGHAAYFSPQAIYFAQRGIVAVTINYRLTRSLTENIPDKIRKQTVSYIEDCVRDSKTAIRWLRTHAQDYHIDPGKIIISGGSAGAHIAGCLTPMDQFNNPGDDLHVSPRPNAMIFFNPAIDFVDSEQGRKIGLAQAERLGMPLEETSPAHLVDQNTPPTLILSGENDPLIPPPLINNFLGRMKENDVQARFIEYAGANHGFFNFWPAHNPYFASTLEHADQYLTELGYLSGQPNVSDLMHWYQTEPQTTVHSTED